MIDSDYSDLLTTEDNAGINDAPAVSSFENWWIVRDALVTNFFLRQLIRNHLSLHLRILHNDILLESFFFLSQRPDKCNAFLQIIFFHPTTTEEV